MYLIRIILLYFQKYFAKLVRASGCGWGRSESDSTAFTALILSKEIMSYFEAFPRRKGEVP